MERILEFNTWITESKNKKFLEDFSYEDYEYVVKNCPQLSKLEENGLLKKQDSSYGRFGSYMNSISFRLNCSSMKSYNDFLYRIGIDLSPDNFQWPEISLNIYFSDKVSLGEYRINEPDTLNRRNFIRVDMNPESLDDIIKLTSEIINYIATDFKKIKVLVMASNYDVPKELKDAIKKNVLRTYREAVDDFFKEGEKLVFSKKNLGQIIAEIYSHDKTIIKTFEEIDDDDLEKQIIKGLEELEENDIVKLLKSYLKTSRTIRGSLI